MAHAIWVETNATGKKGEAQQVRVYFGEYSTQERDTVKKWYSDINTLTLWVVQPGQPEVQLALTDSISYYAATFTPGSKGIYQIVVRHALKDLYSVYKLEYNAIATVWVGEKKMPEPAKADISIAAAGPNFRLDKPTSVKVFFEGKAIAQQELEIVSASGKKEKITTDANGELIFTPKEKGRYLLEAIHKQKLTGKHNDKEYTSVMKIATMSVEVR